MFEVLVFVLCRLDDDIYTQRVCIFQVSVFVHKLSIYMIRICSKQNNFSMWIGTEIPMLKHLQVTPWAACLTAETVICPFHCIMHKCLALNPTSHKHTHIYLYIITVSRTINTKTSTLHIHPGTPDIHPRQESCDQLVNASLHCQLNIFTP